MQWQQRKDGVASEMHQYLWYCLRTSRQLILFKELQPTFQMTAGMFGILINRSRFADSNKLILS